jgi:hypothetical protein
MKNIVEVLRHKELELERIQGEISALRLALRLVAEDGDDLADHGTFGHPLAATGTSADSRVKEISSGSNPRSQFP